MKLRHKIYMCVLILIMVQTAFGCTDKKESEADSDKANYAIQIGLSFDSFVLERWTRDRDIFVSKAAALGAEVNVQNANGSLDTQREQLEYLINKNVDALVIVAADCDGLSDIVEEAKKKEIPVIAYDRLINGAEIDLYISFDNQQVGELMAESLMKATEGKGKYLMLTGPTTDNNIKMIEDGFMNKISGSTIEIADIMHAENWRAEDAYEYLENNSGIINEIDGIMCGNDGIATQVVRFLSENGVAGDIPVVAQDADLEACQHIVEGTQLMTVYKPIDILAEKAAEASVQIAKKYREKNIGSTNKEEVLIEPVAVDKSNIDQVIIAGGFHLKDEVYLNVKE